MPQPRFIADAFGVLTIISIGILVVLGLFCIAYSLYLRSRIRNQTLQQLAFFTSPWLIRIIFIILAILWCVGEFLRLSLLRRKGKPLDHLSSKWQEAICKGYIVSSLGFTEPCLFLTLLLLLRAPLQNITSGILSPHWTRRTSVVLLLLTSPIFLLHLLIVLLSQNFAFRHTVPLKFTRSSTRSNGSSLCAYPLLNTILFGILVTILTTYLLWIGSRILKRVINKVLQRRVYIIIVAVSCLFPMRVVFIGVSVMSEPDKVLYEIAAFMGFFCLVWCLGVCICLAVYCPVADALLLGGEGSEVISLVDESDNRQSISFRAYDRNAFVELSLFAPTHHSSSSTAF